MELTRENGESPVLAMTAAPGTSGSIACTFTLAPESVEKHLILAAQKLENGKPVGAIRIVDVGTNATSPYSITGLEPGVQYAVYAMMADNGCLLSTTISASISATAVAGA